MHNSGVKQYAGGALCVVGILLLTASIFVSMLTLSWRCAAVLGLGGIGILVIGALVYQLTRRSISARGYR